MSTDPNWLYSTIAQSSAAIVAIIGGFITASVLSLSAEKRSLIDQKQDKGTRLELLKHEKAALSQELDLNESKNFITSVVPKIIDSGKRPSFEELITEYPEVQNLNLNTLKKDYEIFTTMLILANDFIENNSNKITPKSGEFIDWVQTNNFDISKYDSEILERIYNRVQAQKRELLPSWERVLLPPTLLKMRLPHIIPITTQQEWQRLRQTIKADTSEIVYLENDVKTLDFRISKFSYPPNLGWAVGVLGFLAVSGILLPVIIMSCESFYTWAKLLTLITFCLGLIGVFGYILFQIRTLKKIDK